ncbi:MAG: small ribosomal subunit Rsm22 family protein [Nitrospiraceae bacterium]
MRPFNRPTERRLSFVLERLLMQECGPDSRISFQELTQGISTLSRLFTTDRTSLPDEYLDDPLLAAAYRAYFMPVNLAKIQSLLDELPDGPGLQSNPTKPLSVLDFGGGPGTGALACLDWIVTSGRPGVRVLSVDRSQTAGQDARRLWEVYCRTTGVRSSTLEVHEADLERSHKGPVWNRIREAAPYEVIIMANCLNELFTASDDPLARRTLMVTEALPLLHPHGTVMVVEPALRPVTRDLHRLRDKLLKQGVCTVYSPCLHEQACPALVCVDDWCHEERPWIPPAPIQAIDQEVGFIKDSLKFSYLLLRKDRRTIVRRKPDVYRVVSELRELKGEKRAWLCNELGRSEVGRLDRLASPLNAAVDEWHRGAIVQIERIVRKEREGKVSAVGRIERDAAVEIVRPA